MKHETDWLSYISMVLACFLWGGSFIALKIAFQVYDPMMVIWARLAVASLCLFFFLKHFKGINFQARDLKYLLLMALCEPCLYYLFEVKALMYTSASQASIITAIHPLLVAIAAYTFLKETVTRRTMAGFGLAIFGACWLSLTGRPDETAPNPLLGNFFEFLAMVCAAGYVVVVKRMSASYPPLFLTGVQSVVGSLFYLPVLFLPGVSLPVKFDPIAGGAVVYLGACVTLGAYGLYNFGISRIPASQASAFINLIPVFTIGLGWIILGERLLPMQYLAAMLIISGVFLSQDRGKNDPFFLKKQTAPPALPLSGRDKRIMI
jgi:drug/metabolite transporter (DMT)-like permease